MCYNTSSSHPAKIKKIAKLDPVRDKKKSSKYDLKIQLSLRHLSTLVDILPKLEVESHICQELFSEHAPPYNLNYWDFVIVM